MPSREEIESMEGPEFEALLRERFSSSTDRPDVEEDEPDEYEAREEMKRANKLNLSDFAAYLDAKRAKGE
jgi:hypothetical protein